MLADEQMQDFEERRKATVIILTDLESNDELIFTWADCLSKMPDTQTPEDLSWPSHIKIILRPLPPA
jgi:hypothetical protein